MRLGMREQESRAWEREEGEDDEEGGENESEPGMERPDLMVWAPLSKTRVILLLFVVLLFKVEGTGGVDLEVVVVVDLGLDFAMVVVVEDGVLV